MSKTLKEVLTEKLEGKNYFDVAIKMGYRKNHTDKPVSRIKLILNDRDLGVRKGYYDFRFNSKQFLEKLEGVKKFV